jgi:hypothetical protein
MMFLGAVFVILWIVAIVIAVVGTFILWDEVGPMAGLTSAAVAVLLLAGLLTFGAKSSDTAMNHCMDSGRAWAIVGHHTELVYNAATKTSIPQDVTDYGCVDRR